MDEPKPSKIKWIEQDGDKIALRKGWDGWRTVTPFKDEQGKVIWTNIIGSWQKWVKSIIILMLILGVFAIYDHATKVCRETVARDKAYFDNLTKQQEEKRKAAEFNASNLSSLNITLVSKNVS